MLATAVQTVELEHQAMCSLLGDSSAGISDSVPCLVSSEAVAYLSSGGW